MSVFDFSYFPDLFFNSQSVPGRLVTIRYEVPIVLATSSFLGRISS